MNISNDSHKKKGRFGLVAGILIVVLLIGNIVYFADVLPRYVDRVTWQQWLFRLDFRYWPFEATYVLWFIFLWLLIDAITFRQRSRPMVDDRGEANTVRVVVLVLKSFVVLSFVAPLLNPMRLKAIQFFLLEYYYIPMTNFFSTGTLSWKLALPPLTALAAIGFLLHVNKMFKSKRNLPPSS